MHYPYFNLHLKLFLFESLQLTQKINLSIFSQYAIIPIFKNSALILFVPYFFFQFLLIDNHIMTDNMYQQEHIYPRIWSGGLWSIFWQLLFIFHKTKIQTVILRCLMGLNMNWLKNYDTKFKYLHFRVFTIL